MKGLRRKPLRSLDIPEEYVEKFWKLYDAAEEESTYSAKYRLWKFVNKILPETGSGWSLDITKLFHPRVIKRDE